MIKEKDETKRQGKHVLFFKYSCYIDDLNDNDDNENPFFLY